MCSAFTQIGEKCSQNRATVDCNIVAFSCLTLFDSIAYLCRFYCRSQTRLRVKAKSYSNMKRILALEVVAYTLVLLTQKSRRRGQERNRKRSNLCLYLCVCVFVFLCLYKAQQRSQTRQKIGAGTLVARIMRRDRVSKAFQEEETKYLLSYDS